MTISNADKCMNCGLCNTVDPIATAVKKESALSRYKVVLAKGEKPSPLFYLSTDPGLQEAICPVGVKFGEIFEQMRAKNVSEGVTTAPNEKMRENMRKYGHPYDNMDHEDFRDKPVW
jgi:Fe-S oxidoreductase